jgi:hypothetical protein
MIDGGATRSVAGQRARTVVVLVFGILMHSLQEIRRRMRLLNDRITLVNYAMTPKRGAKKWAKKRDQSSGERIFWRELVDLIGSSGRIRTYNPSVNSRMLYR